MQFLEPILSRIAFVFVHSAQKMVCELLIVCMFSFLWLIRILALYTFSRHF